MAVWVDAPRAPLPESRDWSAYDRPAYLRRGE